MTAPLVLPQESAKAAQAFADYVALGPSRSLAKLAASYGKSAAYVRQLEVWSSEHNWQERIKARAAEQLEQAQELKTSTYVNILGEYHRRIVEDEPMRRTMKLQSLNSVYDRVKPETPQTSVVLGKVDHTIHFVFEEATGRED